jgi:nicotinate-nucleotide adenylyltransferase
MRLGILGGTFDPIHDGHLAAADAAIQCARLDKVLLIPAGIPPHRGPADASAEQRLAMCELAANADPRLEVIDAEVRRRSGPSYTVDTLRELEHERSGDDLYLILGWDAARELWSWREPKAVLDLARVVVIARPGLPSPGPDDLRRAGLDPARVVLCQEPTPNIAATRIRERLAEGAALDGLVPVAVARYIQEHRLYR